MSVIAPHLREERLLDCYYTDRRGEAPDLAAVDHLSECADCRLRYEELARLLDGLAHEAELEAHLALTPEHLQHQQRQIARRIAQIGRAARVITFPSRFVDRGVAPRVSYGAARWIAGAAVAGLLVGVGVGVFYDSEIHWLYTAPRLTARLQSAKADRTRLNALTGSPQRHAQNASYAATSSDATDAFLSDLDVAAERPHTAALQAFDAFTPHVREASNVRD